MLRTCGLVATVTILLTTVVCEAQENARKKRLAMMCFSTGEQTSGMTKICYYDCLGSPAAITIGAVQLCPLTINR